MGGDSGEYEVSIASASQVKDNLDAERFEVFPVLIRNGTWTYTHENGTKIPFDRNSHALLINGEQVKFDCAYIAIHGTPGEDGKLQGYLDIAGIPYTTCDVTTSALTFNKYFCNDLAIQYGVKVARTIIIRVGDVWDAGQLIEEVGLPCFIKPNKAGSSVGVSKVYDREGISVAVAKAFAEDDEVLVQQFIKGREMACGVFTLNGIITVLPVTEVISKNISSIMRQSIPLDLPAKLRLHPSVRSRLMNVRRLQNTSTANSIVKELSGLIIFLPTINGGSLR